MLWGFATCPARACQGITVTRNVIVFTCSFTRFQLTYRIGNVRPCHDSVRSNTLAFSIRRCVGSHFPRSRAPEIQGGSKVLMWQRREKWRVYVKP
jgi:hypothetical protein